MMCQFGVVESKSATFPAKEKARHLLDDSFLESHSPVRNHTHDSVFTNGISLGTAVYFYCTQSQSLFH